MYDFVNFCQESLLPMGGSFVATDLAPSRYSLVSFCTSAQSILSSARSLSIMGRTALSPLCSRAMISFKVGSFSGLAFAEQTLKTSAAMKLHPRKHQPLRVMPGFSCSKGRKTQPRSNTAQWTDNISGIAKDRKALAAPPSQRLLRRRHTDQRGLAGVVFAHVSCNTADRRLAGQEGNDLLGLSRIARRRPQGNDLMRTKSRSRQAEHGLCLGIGALTNNGNFAIWSKQEVKRDQHLTDDKRSLGHERLEKAQRRLGSLLVHVASGQAREAQECGRGHGVA